MDPIRLVEFDIHGTKPVNKIPGEKIPLTDKNTNWVIPNGSPFFAEYPLTRVYDQNGAELTLNRDWFFEGEFIPFCEITGRRISCFIRLAPAIVAANTHITVDYQSLGAWFVPRNDIEAWLDMITHGNIPIPWSKVFGVPPTLPPSLHMHTIKTEIGDWHELTFFYNYLAGVMQTVDTTLDAQITAAVDAAFARLREAKGLYMQQLVAHDENYHNPHLADKFHIMMGNHPNYATATLAEDKAGVRNDVLSTPLGIQELAKTYIPDTSGAMKTGILPMSKFAGDSFIPPQIDGSFEGLGSLTDSSGICLEPTGQVMVITNHYDGRTEGLYFSIFSDYTQNTSRLRYTAFKYEPPVLKNQGIEVNRIINGSGNKAIMVGQYNTANWYVALTNGSFDPSGHWYSKCDMTDVIAARPGFIGDMANLLTIHHMGDYLVLFFPYQYTLFASDEKFAFFRVRTEDVREGKDVKWERMNLTYQDYDGVSYSNVDYFTPAKAVKNGSNLITKYACWDFPTPITNASHNGRRVGTWSCPHASNRGLWYFHTLVYPTFALQAPGNNASYSDLMNMAYEFNPATGVMTKIAQSPTVVMDFGPDPEVLPSSLAAKRLSNFQGCISVSTGCSSVWLPTGELLNVYTTNNNTFPAQIQTMRWNGFDTDAAILSGGVELQRIGQPAFWRAIPHEKIAPIASGAYPAGVFFEPDGEVYGAVIPGDVNRAIYFRKVTGDYQVREGINNLNVPSVQARPLSNNIFKTNLLHEDIMINVTGSAPVLSAAGVEAGAMSLSGAAFTNYLTGTNQWLPYSAKMKAASNPSGVLVTFPRTYSRTLDNALKTAEYAAATFYGLNQAVADKIKAEIPAAKANTPWYSWSFFMLNGENGPMFSGLNFGIVQLYFMDPDTYHPYVVTMMVQPTIEAPNASHPGIYLITDFTIIDKTVPYRGANGSQMNNTATVGFARQNAVYRIRPSVQIYNDGTRLTVFIVHPWFARTTSTSHTKLLSTFEIVLGTRKIENKYAGSTDWAQGDIMAMIPKVGATDANKGGETPETSVLSLTNPTAYAYTGGAGTLVKRTVGETVTYYLTCTAYAETGWVLYIQDGITMMLNGTIYSVPGGTIDLRDVDVNPANKTYYLYVTVEDDEPRYLISSEKLRESGSLMKAAMLTTNEKQILTITRYQPFVIGDFKLSYTREGGIIPVSSGFPQDEGKFIFLRYAELKP